MPLIAWSSLGRGFFVRGDEADTSDPDLVRVFYSPENFERRRRATELAKTRGLSMFEIALAWITCQRFPMVALCGAKIVDEVESSLSAGNLALSSDERAWLDLSSDSRPL